MSSAAVALCVLACAAPALGARARADGDGTVTIEYPENFCHGDRHALPDVTYSPHLEADAPVNRDIPESEIEQPETEDVPADEEFVDDSDWPDVQLEAWRVVYFPDGSWVSWHDDTCIEEDEVSIEPIAPTERTLYRASKLSRSAMARTARHRARRRALRDRS